MLKKLKGNDFWLNIAKVGSGNIVAQLISIVSIPILSRVYSVSAYGANALLVSTGAIIAALAAIGLTSAIMRPKADTDVKKVFLVAYITQAVISGTVVMVAFALNGVYLLFGIEGDYALNLAIMLAYIWSINLYGMLAVYANRNGLYKVLMLNAIIAAITQAGLSIILGLLNCGWYGLIFTAIIAQILPSIHILKANNPFTVKLRLRDFIEVYKGCRKYITYQWPANFISDYSYQYPTQSFSRLFSTDQLGSYNMCDRIIRYPVRLIARPISTVYFKTASDYLREGKDIAEFSYRLIKKVFVFSLIPTILIVLFGERMITFALGDKWGYTGAMASAMIPLSVYMLCSECIGYFRVSAGKQKATLVYSIIGLAVDVTTITLGNLLFGDMLSTVFLYVVAKCLYYIGDISLNFYFMGKRLRESILMMGIHFLLIIGVIVIRFSIFSR